MVFIKHIKSIDKIPLISDMLKAPLNSRFIFIFTVENLIIVDKHDFIEFFRTYRRMQAKTFTYSNKESLSSNQMIHGQFLDFVHASCSVEIKEDENQDFQEVLVVKTSNNKKISVKQKKSSQQSQKSENNLQKVITETICLITQSNLSLYIKKEEGFVFSLEFVPPIKLVEGSNQIYLCENNIMIILYKRIVYVYSLKLCLPKQNSNQELINTIDLSPVNQDFLYYSKFTSTLYTQASAYTFEKHDKFILKPIFNFTHKKYKQPQPIQQDQSKSQDEITITENFQLIDEKKCAIISIFNGYQSIFLQKEKLLFEMKDINKMFTAAVSNYRYCCPTLDITISVDNIDQIKQKCSDSQQFQEYDIVAVSMEIETPKPQISFNCISLYKIFNQLEPKLAIQILDFPHEILYLYFLTPYDLVYQDQSNYIGIISLNVNDLGLVLQN